METLPLEKIGFWGLLVLNLIKDGLLPALGKIIPSRIHVTEREQNRIDKKQDFEQQMELRHVEAIEGIKEVLLAVNQRLNNIDEKLKIKRPLKK